MYPGPDKIEQLNKQVLHVQSGRDVRVTQRLLYELRVMCATIQPPWLIEMQVIARFDWRKSKWLQRLASRDPESGTISAISQPLQVRRANCQPARP